MSLFARARAAGKACRVTLIDPAPRLLGFLPERRRKPLLDFLTDHGVVVRSNTWVESLDHGRGTAGGLTDEPVFFCWAGGSKRAAPEIKGDVEPIRDGRLKVYPDLSLPGYLNVFAAGDSAAIEQQDAVLRKAVNYAYSGGYHAGTQIRRQLRGQPTRAFHPLDLGWVIPLHTSSIGRLPGGLWVHGFLGVRLHHLMCGLRNTSLKNFAGCLKLALKGRTP
jgi:NADH:quinone reductase (non-electrogenic)